ncbi:hypothetical protein, partial [Teichococcus wenyumeiae]|uniref:hypothetical protein n=1 Tax=Teichococcus wenyumeiae TaxID=2478470 RepID=UPI001F1EBE5C
GHSPQDIFLAGSFLDENAGSGLSENQQAMPRFFTSVAEMVRSDSSTSAIGASSSSSLTSIEHYIRYSMWFNNGVGRSIGMAEDEAARWYPP